MVDVKFKREFPAMLTLESLRQVPGLKDMILLKRGSRLSIQPVSPEEFAIVMKLAGN
jgi:predicted RNA-binding protein with PUA-like domain